MKVTCLAYFMPLIDGVFSLGRACYKQIRDAFESLRSTEVRSCRHWWETALRRNSLLKSTPQPQIAKNTKTPILEVQRHLRSLMFRPI